MRSNENMKRFYFPQITEVLVWLEIWQTHTCYQPLTYDTSPQKCPSEAFGKRKLGRQGGGNLRKRRLHRQRHRGREITGKVTNLGHKTETKASSAMESFRTWMELGPVGQIHKSESPGSHPEWRKTSAARSPSCHQHHGGDFWWIPLEDSHLAPS